MRIELTKLDRCTRNKQQTYQPASARCDVKVNGTAVNEIESMSNKLNVFSLSLVSLVMFCVLMPLQAKDNEDQLALQTSSDVKLLKFPYPYSAAVTVAADTHRTSVELFEGVHTLINTRSRIPRNSELWKKLFNDPEIDKREAWREGIDGFGLPIADTFWLYDNSIGAFERFDLNTKKPVPHSHNNKDFRGIIDEWIRKGWIDTLHTPGPGDIRREAVAQGLAWLTEKPHRHMKVWINHSITGTPSSIEPDVLPALNIVFKNIVKLGTAFLSYAGADRLARKIVANPYPSQFPPGQKLVCWLLTIFLTGSLLCVFVSLVLRKPRIFLIGTFTFLITVSILYKLPLSYGQGDNPKSPYYNLDLVRKAGFRYFWFVESTAGYQSHIENRLGLPELSSPVNRRTFLRVVTVDDGSRVIAFPRNYKGYGGSHSLELLTEAALENLCKQAGTAILYTHWSKKPKILFTARGLEGLQNLRRFYEEKRVWVAPTSKILHFHFVRTFLEYDVYRENGRRIINIKRINNPIGKPVIPTLEDLRGITFESEASNPIEVHLAGTPVKRDLLQVLHMEDRMIIYFRGYTDII